MQRIPVPYADTGRFNSLVIGYLKGDRRLKDHYRWQPDRTGLEAAAEARAFAPGARAALCRVLEAQYGGQPVQPEVRTNLDRLRDPDTLTVTTGHQLCLFTGPLYVPFKILNVVRLARELSTNERAVVPVFWMATEDHDRPEIDHAWIHGQRVEWPGSTAGAVGKLPLEGMEGVLEQVDELLGLGTHADELRALLHRCYRPEYDLATATRSFVDALFGRFGVIVLDADEPDLKRLFIPQMRSELLEGVAQKEVADANARLAKHWSPQAFARAINLFYLTPGARRGIELQGDRFQVLDGGPAFNRARLLAELEEHPERFSPNVILRPVYQEVVLPNIAYVGGGGELSYWFQLKGVFDRLGVPMPSLILRTSAALLTQKDVERTEALGLGVPELFASWDVLSARIAKQRAVFSTSMQAERDAAALFYARLLQRASAADRTLEGAVKAIEKKAQRGLDALERKLVRAAKRSEQESLARLASVHQRLFPGGGLQERRDNFMPWYAQQGPAFFDQLLEHLDPLDPRFSVLLE